MSNSTIRRKPLPQYVVFIAGFVAPTIVLFALSDESKLGPLAAMGLALAFPIVLELYSLITGRKASLLSLFAIIGIMLIGVISLFGLSEEWLGVRRAGIYLIAGVGLLIIIRFKRSLLDAVLGRIINMPIAMAAASKNGTKSKLTQRINATAHGVALLLLATAVWSYLLTLIVISAPAGTSQFNSQYAELRLISLPFVTLPLLVGMAAFLMYLVYGIEKITGLDTDLLLQRKR